MRFELPDLPYDYAALEPHFDARTMEIHHTRHHATYVNKLNAAIDGHDLDYKCIGELLAHFEELPEQIRTAVRNHGGGHANHSLFWKILSPNGGGQPEGEVAEAIDSELGGFDHFRELFTNAAVSRFGSGWAWLGFDPDHKLAVWSTANQDSPLIQGHIPLLGLDVWEHAYYLKYQNRRDEYIDAFWNLANWEYVNERYTSVSKGLHVAHAV